MNKTLILLALCAVIAVASAGYLRYAGYAPSYYGHGHGHGYGYRSYYRPAVYTSYRPVVYASHGHGYYGHGYGARGHYYG